MPSNLEARCEPPRGRPLNVDRAEEVMKFAKLNTLERRWQTKFMITYFSIACGGPDHWAERGHRGILIVVTGKKLWNEKQLGFKITHLHPNLDRPEDFFLQAPQGVRDVPGVKDAMINAGQVTAIVVCLQRLLGTSPTLSKAFGPADWRGHMGTLFKMYTTAFMRQRDESFQDVMQKALSYNYRKMTDI